MRRLRLLLILGAVQCALPAQNFDFGIGDAQVTPSEFPPGPFSTYYICNSFQQVIPASELQAQGVVPGSRVSSLWLIVDQAVGLHWDNVTILIDHFDSDGFYSAGSTFNSNAVSRANPQYYLRWGGPHVDVPGWNIFDATHGGFFWNGTSNIVVDILVTGRTAEYPNGTTNGDFGPTLRATTGYQQYGFEANQTGEANGAQDVGCAPSLGWPLHKKLDMRLVFTTTAINDDCDAAILGDTAGTFEATAQGGTTAASLPGNPALVDEVWSAFQNTDASPRRFTISCSGYHEYGVPGLPLGFDAAAASYRGVCGALTFDAFDDDGAGTPGDAFRLSFVAQPGEIVYVAIGRKAGSAPATSLRFLMHVEIIPTARVDPLGSGCGFSGGLAPLLFASAPTLGGSGTIGVVGAPPSSFLILLLGAPTTATDFLGTGCQLYIDPATFYILQFVLTDAYGAWLMTAPLPTASALAGVAFGLQAVVLSTSHPQPIGTTNALQLTFGG